MYDPTALVIAGIAMIYAGTQDSNDRIGKATIMAGLISFIVGVIAAVVPRG